MNIGRILKLAAKVIAAAPAIVAVVKPLVKGKKRDTADDAGA